MRRLGPLGWLIAAVAVLSSFRVAFAALGMMPSAAADRLTSYGLSLALILGVVDDARARRCVPCFDFGFLVAVFCPASLAWYVLRSRGRRGALTLVALHALMLAPSVAAGLAWMVRNQLG